MKSIWNFFRNNPIRQCGRIVWFSGRTVLLRVGPRLLFLYAVLLPAVWYMYQGLEESEAVRRVFGLAQMALAIAALWGLFLFFLPVLTVENNEILRALRHPDDMCILLLFGEQQLIAAPFYAALLGMYPDQCGMIGMLVLQALCISFGYYALSRIVQSPVAGTIILLLYILLSYLIDGSPQWFLIQKYGLGNDFSLDYVLVRAGFLAVGRAAVFLKSK